MKARVFNLLGNILSELAEFGKPLARHQGNG